MQLFVEPLSERELEVLQWLASGASNREIGLQLIIAESTVKRHVYNIFGKLNAWPNSTWPTAPRRLSMRSRPAWLKAKVNQ